MYSKASTLLAMDSELYIGGRVWAVLKCANALPQFLLLFSSVVPIIPVVIPLAVDLSDVSENNLVIQRPTPENNGRGL